MPRDRGNTGNVVCNTSFTNLSDSRVKTEISSWRPSSTSARLRRNEVEEPDGTEMVTLDSPQRALGARLDKGSLAGPAGAEEAHKKHGRRPQANHQGRLRDPRTGFGSIAQTLQQAQVRDPSISREEVKAFLDGLRVNQDRPQRGNLCRAKKKPKKKKKRGSKKRGPRKKGKRGFLWQRLTSLETQPGAKLQAYLGVIILQPHACAQRFRLRILRRTRSNAGRTSAGSLSGRIESIWKTPSKERGEAHGIACLESGRNTERACNTAARSCPSSLSKFPGRTWTSGSARGKHVIKLVQVPCPSSCPSSGFRPGPRSWNRGLPGIGACLESGRCSETYTTLFNNKTTRRRKY